MAATDSRTTAAVANLTMQLTFTKGQIRNLTDALATTSSMSQTTLNASMAATDGRITAAVANLTMQLTNLTSDLAAQGLASQVLNCMHLIIGLYLFLLIMVLNMFMTFR